MRRNWRRVSSAVRLRSQAATPSARREDWRKAHCWWARQRPGVLLLARKCLPRKAAAMTAGQAAGLGAGGAASGGGMSGGFGSSGPATSGGSNGGSSPKPGTSSGGAAVDPTAPSGQVSPPSTARSNPEPGGISSPNGTASAEGSASGGQQTAQDANPGGASASRSSTPDMPGQVSPPSSSGKAEPGTGRLARASEATTRVSRKLAIGTQFVRMARSAVPPDHAPHSAPPALRSEGDE